MNKQQQQELLDRYISEIRELEGMKIYIELSPLIAMVIIGQLQLALRHPKNTGPGSQQARILIETFKNHLDRPAIQQVIEMGFNPEFDIEAD